VIDEIDSQLKEWLASVVGAATVSLAAPRPESDHEPSVNLHLLEVDNDLPSQRRGRRPLDILLGYLVTTAGKTAIVLSLKAAKPSIHAVSKWNQRFISGRVVDICKVSEG